MNREYVSELIARYIFEMGISTLVIVISYLIISESSLPSFASVAKYYENNQVNMQVKFEPKPKNITNNKYTYIDGGTITVYNPNDDIKNTTLQIVAFKKSSIEVENLIIFIDGEEVKIHYFEDESYYFIDMLSEDIDLYKNKIHDLEVYTKITPKENQLFQYSVRAI